MQNQFNKSSDEKMVEKSTKYIDIFRRNIDKLMEEHDYTIKETAEIADLSYDTFKTFLYDKEAKDCRLSTAVKIARAFHISIDELVGADTIEPKGLESIKIYRTLPEGSRRFLDWQIQNQQYLHQQHSGKKIANIMVPLCSGNGNLKLTNDYEIQDITHLGDELTYKIFLGIKIPCLHYLPHYTEGDVLLLANDRTAMKGENTVIQIEGNLMITNRVMEEGKPYHYGLWDKKFRIAENEDVDVLGYVAKILRV